jgi:uncharacterized membrane protein YdfJ with MMPL/SSD domain
MARSKADRIEDSPFASLPMFPGTVGSPQAETTRQRRTAAFVVRWVLRLLIAAIVVLLAFALAYLLVFVYGVLLYIYSPPNPG